MAVLTRLRTVDNSHLLELQELNKIHNIQDVLNIITKNKEVYVGEVPANGGRHEVDNGVIQHAKYLFTRNTYVVN